MYNIINLIIDIIALIIFLLFIVIGICSSKDEWTRNDWIKLVIAIFIFYIAGDYKLFLVPISFIYVIFFTENQYNKTTTASNNKNSNSNNGYSKRQQTKTTYNHNERKTNISTNHRKYHHNSHNTYSYTSNNQNYNYKPEKNNYNNRINSQNNGVKLLFKQKTIDWSGIYDVYYENGNIAYKIDGYRSLSWGDARLKIMNSDDEEMGRIEERTVSTVPTFDVYENGKRLGTISRTYGIFTPGAKINFKEWDIECGYNDYEFTITDKKNKSLIAEINKKYLTGTDTYELNITDFNNSLYIVMFIIAMDLYNARYNQNKKW